MVNPARPSVGHVISLYAGVTESPREEGEEEDSANTREIYSFNLGSFGTQFVLRVY